MSYFLPPQAEHLCWLVQLILKKSYIFNKEPGIQKLKTFYYFFLDVLGNLAVGRACIHGIRRQRNAKSPVENFLKYR